jgi:catechol-2,3-dioxygenase
VGINGLCELVLETNDLPRLERFYVALGLEVLSREPDRVWLAVGPNSRLGLWTSGEKEHRDRGGRHVHFALSVETEELSRLRGTLERHDTRLEGPVEHEGGDRSLYFFDPAGNRVELWDFFTDERNQPNPIAELAQ